MQNPLAQIIQSYELSPGLERRIMRIASRGVKEQSICAFSEMYNYVGRLIERVRERYEPRLARLDHPLREEGKLLGEMVADTHIETNETAPEYQQLKTAFEEKVRMMFPILSEAEQRIFTSLVENSSHHYIPATFIDDTDALKERLGLLNDLAKEDKRFLQPERPIVAVSLDPENPYVRWGARKYGGDPLEYLTRHAGAYKGMSATELRKLDPGLYYALHRKGQTKSLPQKYPHKKVPLTLEQRRNILLAYDSDSAQAVALKTGLPLGDVERVLKKNGLGEGRSGRLGAQTIVSILDSYESSGGNRRRALRLFNREPVGSMAIQHIF